MHPIPVLRSFSALKHPRWIPIVAACLLAAACQDHLGPASGLPDRIDFVSPGLYPEAVAYDPLRNAFIVSSLAQGQAGSVSATGTYQPFAQDPEIISSFGVHVDNTRGRILVAVGDLGFSPRSSPQTIGKQAFLAIYDQAAGRRQALVRLGDLRPNVLHIPNDIATDPAGNAYVTDSFSGIIYKVDPDGRPSVLSEAPALAPIPNGSGFGLSGIVYHPDGYLIVTKLDVGKLLKVSLKQPITVTEISLNESITSPDAILLSPNGQRIIVVTNGFTGGPNSVVAFETKDNWASARQTDSFLTGTVGPTSATTIGNDVYVLYSYFNQFLAGNQPPVTTFSVQKMPFTLNGQRQNLLRRTIF